MVISEREDHTEGYPPEAFEMLCPTMGTSGRTAPNCEI
jgi:hypothetical protein